MIHTPHVNGIRTLAFSSQRLFCASLDGALEEWDVDTHRMLVCLHSNALLTSFAFNLKYPLAFGILSFVLHFIRHRKAASVELFGTSLFPLISAILRWDQKTAS